jgi:hypothetical protein
VTERNPYLILGVDFGASGAEARRRFALAARRIRREGGRWAKDDLTWALHEVESLETDPADSVSIFRVPADPQAFEPAGEGLFKPPPVPLPRRTEPTTPEVLEGLRRAAARELVWMAVAAGSEQLDVRSLDYPTASPPLAAPPDPIPMPAATPAGLPVPPSPEEHPT